MSVEGHKAADGEDMQAFMNALSPGYFQTMQIPVLEGRDFRESDQYNQFDDAAPDRPRVAIVNQKFARHFFKGAESLANGSALVAGRTPSSTSRSSASSPIRSTKGRARASVVRCSSQTGVVGAGVPFYMRTATASGWRLRPDPQRSATARFRDAGLQPQDAAVAARRDAAHRPTGRASLGRIRAAGHGAGVGRSCTA